MALLMRLVLLLAIVGGLVALLRKQYLGRETSVKADVGAEVRDTKEAVANSNVSSITNDLKRTGRVARRKVTTGARTVPEATQDGRTTAAIRAKLARDPELSALNIGVDTTDGRVTLVGRVSSPEHVAKAVRLALEEKNVREVASTLQVIPRALAVK
jgi:hyperosmotically inducible protein